MIELRHKEELEFSEIAARMGLNTSDAARKRFTRAIERLQGKAEVIGAEVEVH